MTDPALAPLFPAAAVVVVARPEMWEAPLHPEEAVSVARAVEHRRREFAAGRACAREALTALEIPPQPLLVGPDRAPVWPPGVVGSLTHCEGFCAAVVAPAETAAGLGLDAEPAQPLPEEVLETVLTDSEQQFVDTQPLPATAPTGADWARLVFSAKESVYKCQSSCVGLSLDFHDVELEIDPQAEVFQAVLRVDVPAAWPQVRRLTGRYRWLPQHVVTGVVLPSGSPAPGRSERTS
ncbi:MAG: 4'-phosphopantetheinyl transferase superfamily protein [Proteobacteria bacterium]|nr:4'-phosphopantetheinyl transferase superfamily protein [Pseudomonadota bacterium]